MEQGYGANPEMSRDNGPVDYSDLNQVGLNQGGPSSSYLDYNGLDYPVASDPGNISKQTYASPPNPCPKGVKGKTCIEDMPDTAEYSQMYQALNKNGVSKMNADMLNSFFQSV